MLSRSDSSRPGLIAFPAPQDRPRAADHDLTVIVPAFNEQKRLPATLRGLQQNLDAWGIPYRVLVVDNGSSDGTCEITERFNQRFSTIQERRRGKGAAVRLGMLSATGRVLAFTDADLPYDLEALRTGYEWIRRGECDAVFGARDLQASDTLVERRKCRRIASSVFRHVSRLLVSRSVTDTQCGLKLFRREAAVALFSQMVTDGFAFDAELVYLTCRWQLPFRRVPVTLINEYASTISIWREALPMLKDVVGFRWRALQGCYPCPTVDAAVRETDRPGRAAA